jgi:hypothetical protein
MTLQTGPKHVATCFAVQNVPMHARHDMFIHTLQGQSPCQLLLIHHSHCHHD